MEEQQYIDKFEDIRNKINELNTEINSDEDLTNFKKYKTQIKVLREKTTGLKNITVFKRTEDVTEPEQEVGIFGRLTTLIRGPQPKPQKTNIVVDVALNKKQKLARNQLASKIVESLDVIDKKIDKKKSSIAQKIGDKKKELKQEQKQQKLFQRTKELERKRTEERNRIEKAREEQEDSSDEEDVREDVSEEEEEEEEEEEDTDSNVSITVLRSILNNPELFLLHDKYDNESSKKIIIFDKIFEVLKEAQLIMDIWPRSNIAYNFKIVLTGGYLVNYYSKGKYPTGDIDFKVLPVNNESKANINNCIEWLCNYLFTEQKLLLQSINMSLLKIGITAAIFDVMITLMKKVPKSTYRNIIPCNESLICNNNCIIKFAIQEPSGKIKAYCDIAFWNSDSKDPTNIIKNDVILANTIDEHGLLQVTPQLLFVEKNKLLSLNPDEYKRDNWEQQKTLLKNIVPVGGKKRRLTKKVVKKTKRNVVKKTKRKAMKKTKRKAMKKTKKCS